MPQSTSDEKSDIQPRSYTCVCEKVHEYPAYVFAHWYEELVHTCDCGAKHEIFRGKATLITED